MQQISWSRAVLAAVLVEVAVIGLIMLLTLLFSPREVVAAQEFILSLSQWVNPVGAFVGCLIGGYWVAKNAPGRPVDNGVAVGLIDVALNLSLAAALGSPFPVLLFVSAGGRLLAATMGGLLAAHRRAAAPR